MSHTTSKQSRPENNAIPNKQSRPENNATYNKQTKSSWEQCHTQQANKVGLRTMPHTTSKQSRPENNATHNHQSQLENNCFNATYNNKSLFCASIYLFLRKWQIWIHNKNHVHPFPLHTISGMKTRNKTTILKLWNMQNQTMDHNYIVTKVTWKHIHINIKLMWILVSEYMSLGYISTKIVNLKLISW